MRKVWVGPAGRTLSGGGTGEGADQIFVCDHSLVVQYLYGSLDGG